MADKTNFKKVPALEKCFNILDFLSNNKKKTGISDIANELGYHKSTVYNMVYSLIEIGILEMDLNNKVRLGAHLYSLGRAAGSSSELITILHPYLEEIHNKLNLSVYLGMLNKDLVLTVDKVESPIHPKVSSEIGLSTHILVGAVGKVTLSKMSDERINKILSENKLKKYTDFSITNKKKFFKMIMKAREDGFAYSNQEYIEGIRALAVPLSNYKGNILMSIYVLGLNSQIKDKDILPFAEFLKGIAKSINDRFAMI